MKIIHVDMDAFYASIEIRDRPELKGKAVIVGGINPQARGVVSAASYEARRFGVHSAQPLSEAYRRCPHGEFLEVDMEKYIDVSRELMKIFRKFTPLVEPLSIDEAFLDVSGCENLFGDCVTIGKKVKAKIKKELDLTASVGIARTKFLAKLASALEKPDGFVVIPPEETFNILHPLPVEKLWGVGMKTAMSLRGQGFNTIGQIASTAPALLEAKFGSMGKTIWELANGIDLRIVEVDNRAKSITREYTFYEDVDDLEYLKAVLLYLAEDVGQKLRLKKITAKTIILKLRYSDFSTVSRQKTLARSINIGSQIYREGLKLFHSLDLKKASVRLIGIGVASLAEEDSKQLSLFNTSDEREEKIARVMDSLKEKYGADIIKPSRLLELKKGGQS